MPWSPPRRGDGVTTNETGGLWAFVRAALQGTVSPRFLTWPSCLQASGVPSRATSVWQQRQGGGRSPKEGSPQNHYKCPREDSSPGRPSKACALLFQMGDRTREEETGPLRRCHSSVLGCPRGLWVVLGSFPSQGKKKNPHSQARFRWPRVTVVALPEDSSGAGPIIPVFSDEEVSDWFREFPQEGIQALASWMMHSQEASVPWALYLRAEGTSVPVHGCPSYLSIAMTKLHDQGIV